MKKHLIFMLGILMHGAFSFAQGGAVTNLRTAASFLGYNAGVFGPLDIRNDFLTCATQDLQSCG